MTAMTRREERAAALREAGAVPAVVRRLRRGGLRAAVERAAPEVVVHELTDLPPALDPRKMEEQLAGNDRIRTEGTRNLVAAAVAAGARRIVAQSIAFAYAPTGEAAEARGRAALGRRALAVVAQRRGAARAGGRGHRRPTGIEGLVLRYGFFYGPGLVVRGRAGSGRARCAGAASRWSARAPACSRSSTSTTPPRPRWRRSSAARRASTTSSTTSPRRCATGCRPTRRRSGRSRRGACRASWPGCWRAGTRSRMATELRGASNERAKAELGWQPRYASWRQGFREALRLEPRALLGPRAPARAWRCSWRCRSSSMPVRDRAHRLVARARSRAREMSIVHSCAESQ